MHKAVLSTVVALFAVTLNVVAQAPAANSETEALTRLLVEKGLISAADMDAAMAEAESNSLETRLDELVSTMAVPAVGSSHTPGHGVTFEDGAFSLTVRGGVQFRLNIADFDVEGAGDQDTELGFSVPRARIWIEGAAFENWAYELELDVAGGLQGGNELVNSNGGAGFLPGEPTAGSQRSALLLDARVTWMNNGGSEFQVSIGQFKAPYGRVFLTEFWQQQFVERALIPTLISRGRQIGVMAHGTVGGDNGDLIDYHVGIFNGEGPNQQTLNTSTAANLNDVVNFGGNNDEGFLYVGRVQINPFGGQELTEGDARTGANRDLILQIGFNAFYDTNDAAGQEDPFGIGADVALFVEGFSGLVVIDYAEDAMETEILSFLVQIGYFVVPGEFEVAGRFQYADFEGMGIDAEYFEVGAVATYFIHGHRAKAQLEVLYSDAEAGVLGSGVPAGGDVETILFRIQIQLLF